MCNCKFLVAGLMLMASGVVFGCANDKEDADYWRKGQPYILYVDTTENAGGATGEERFDEVPPSGIASVSADLPREISETNEILPAGHYYKEAMTLDELAMALRPIVGDADGKVYIAKHPNYELAESVLNASDEPIQFEGESAQNFELPDRELEYIFGSDNRSIPTIRIPTVG